METLITQKWVRIEAPITTDANKIIGNGLTKSVKK
jgi:hypothetical protein